MNNLTVIKGSKTQHQKNNSKEMHNDSQAFWAILTMLHFLDKTGL